MGYQKGFGLQLICLLLNIIKPTDVVQIQHSIKSFNFHEIVTDKFVRNFQYTLFSSTDLNGLSNQCFFTTHMMDSNVNTAKNSKWISNSSSKRKLIVLCHLAKLLNRNSKCLNDVIPFS